MNKPSFHVTIDLSQPETHRAKVTIASVTDDLPTLLQFPVWTPGSYLIRDYSRHITLLEPADKISKNAWRLRGAPRKVSYEVYCFERTVRTSFVDEHYAALVGATLLPLLHAPFTVEMILPKNWNTVSSALKFRKRGAGRWFANVQNDDQWIDSPIVACMPGYGGTGSFRCNGITHHITWVGAECARSMEDMEEAFKKIATTTLAMFGGAPFREYWFLLQFGHKLYGGLEHRDSQLSQFDGANLAEPKDWDGFLRLIAHEYFHSWNVKSLRPRALGPFDYFSENYTQDIWFAEGLTDYFDDLLCFRAGILSEEAYLKARCKDISLFADGHPGHERRSLGESSFDAWIRYYRPDEDSVNTDVSYYGKGAVLGWCWDAHLQKKSRGKWNLTKLMKAFWKEFGVDADVPLQIAKPGYTREEILQFAEKHTGITQRTLVESWVMGRRPLPWREAARFFKVKWKETISDPAMHLLGLQLHWKGQAYIQKVLSNSAAERAHLSANDELIAINGTRVADNEKLQVALKTAIRSGRTLKLTISRLDRLIERKISWRKHEGVGVEISPDL